MKVFSSKYLTKQETRRTQSEGLDRPLNGVDRNILFAYLVGGPSFQEYGHPSF